MPRTSRNRKKRNTETRHRLNYGEADYRRAMAARNFALVVEKGLDPYTVMLAITSTENPVAADAIANATGSLVYTGEKDFLVTNHHVYAAFQSYRAENPQSKLIMSGAHGTRFLNISGVECLGLSEEFDLAVLSMPREWVSIQRKLFLPFDRWPPERPDKGMLAVLFGYPGEGRRVEQNGALGASPLSIGMRIVSVSARHFVIADEDQDAHEFVPKGENRVTRFGGMSGSAVHAVRPPVAAFEDAWLCGFMYEEGPGRTIVVAHADHINADGSID